LVDGKPKPENISKLSAAQLREVGVSGAKARSMHDLSHAILSGDLKFHRFPKLSNQEIAAELTKIWGIGRWTSEMFLMFHLGRLDVWPVGDLGMRRGWEKLHRMRNEIDPKKLDVIGEKFAGFQSVVAWYCWRVTDEGETTNW
jgi:DNA-3-methyladenine glycosylase II